MTLEFIRAFKSGSTRPSMAFLALASLVQASQFLLASSPMMASRKVALSYVADPNFWAYAHIVVAMLVIWRMADLRSRPFAAWVVNGLMLWVWSLTYVSPALAFEDMRNLLSVVLVMPVMAAWVLIRTESTSRDKVNA
jgi:hypothetical protein